MAEQRLRHVIIDVDSILYFYDGELPVKEGVVTIPDGNDVWAGAAWINGYQIDAETGESLLWTDVVDRALASAAGAESATETDADEGASSDDRGQPADEDGLRAGEQPRDEGVRGRFLGRRGGDRPADGEEGADD